MAEPNELQDKIAPCPWCGSSAVKSGVEAPVYIECNGDDCGAFGPERPTVAEAIEAWNKVANMAQRFEECRSTVDKLVFTFDEKARELSGMKLELAQVLRTSAAALPILSHAIGVCTKVEGPYGPEAEAILKKFTDTLEGIINENE